MAGHSGIDLRDLRYFAAVAETQNLSRAARVVRVAQPAFSRRIRALERALGVALLERHARGAALTPAGESFAAGTTRLLGETAAALDRAEATAAGRRGRIVLSALRAAIVRGFPSAVQDSLRRDHPEIVLVVQDHDPPATWEAVVDGRADLAVSVEDALPPGLLSQPLWGEALDCAIVPYEHPLARRTLVTLEDLAALPLVVPRQTLEPAALERLLDSLRAAGLRSPLRALDGDLRASHLAVAAGRGWALLARSRAAMPPEGTAALAIAGMHTTMGVVALWRRNERRPAVQTVLRCLLEVARGYPESRVRAAAAPARRAPRARRPAGTVPAALQLRHLRALVAVATDGTIGRAARRLGVSQPALSRQLRELEHATGVVLLERSARGTALTPAGASLAGDGPGLLDAAARLPRDVQRAQRGMEGRCVIGAVATAATGGLLARVMRRSAIRIPHVQILVDEVPTPAQPAALVQGAIDLGLAHRFPTAAGDRPERVDAIALHEDRLDCALLPADHALAGRRRIAARALADVPFLFMDRAFHPGFYDRVCAALGDLGLVPRVEATYDGLQAVWALVAHGKGWGLGFHSHLARPPAATTAVRIAGFDLPFGIELLSRPGESSPAVRAVIDAFREARASTRGGAE